MLLSDSTLEMSSKWLDRTRKRIPGYNSSEKSNNHSCHSMNAIEIAGCIAAQDGYSSTQLKVTIKHIGFIS